MIDARLKRRQIILAAIFLATGGLASVYPASRALASDEKALAAHSIPAPGFTLPDSNGKARSLNDFRGRRVALFFFCGCEWCHRCAHIWGQMQRAGAVSGADEKETPITLVVFQGDAGEAKQFAGETGLDLGQTILLADDDMHVTLSLYHAEICPRVFVLNEKGAILYTNNHKDDLPRKAPEMVIATRALKAIQDTGAARSNL